MTETRNVIEGTDYSVRISGKIVDSGVPFGNDDTDGMLHNKFKITLETENGKCSFEFFGSYIDYKEGKKELTESDLIDCFDCFLLDATSGSMDFEDFVSEFGYNDLELSEYPRIKKIHSTCQKQLKSFGRLLPFSDIYDVSNELRENYSL